MYELKNHMETVVQHALHDYITHFKLACDCPRCQFDIQAMTLNQLPCRYFVSLTGEIMTQLKSQQAPDQARVMAALVKAVNQVALTPSHESSSE